MRRVDCRRCGVVAVEEVPWGDGKRRESFQQLQDHSSPAWAGKFLDEWCRQPGAPASNQRCGGGPEQQGQGHHEKIPLLPHLLNARTRPVSLTWQGARARINPQFFLTNLRSDERGKVPVAAPKTPPIV